MQIIKPYLRTVHSMTYQIYTNQISIIFLQISFQTGNLTSTTCKQHLSTFSQKSFYLNKGILHSALQILTSHESGQAFQSFGIGMLNCKILIECCTKNHTTLCYNLVGKNTEHSSRSRLITDLLIFVVCRIADGQFFFFRFIGKFRICIRTHFYTFRTLNTPRSIYYGI